ncbi:unnamed protein product [Toxocara canis]|uniref:Uncharacterized protein n=1 Tax=Toxocara canis TaxID=6265 RepID=A0A183TWG2_TOXCA|nr:unnamed protein product [Toxocara canis]
MTTEAGKGSTSTYETVTTEAETGWTSTSETVPTEAFTQSTSTSGTATTKAVTESMSTSETITTEAGTGSTSASQTLTTKAGAGSTSTSETMTSEPGTKSSSTSETATSEGDTEPTRSRVDPIRGITIPRLELMAALIGSRLLLFLREQLERTRPMFLWSDSQASLHWIATATTMNRFVDNPLVRIRRSPAQFRYVESDNNPTD